MHLVRKQTHALAVVPHHLEQPTATTTEHKKMSTVRIALQLLLHQEGQAIKALALMRSTA